MKHQSSKNFREYGLCFRIACSADQPDAAIAAVALTDWEPTPDLGQHVDLDFLLEHSSFDGVEEPAYRLRVDGVPVLGGGRDRDQFLRAAERRIHWFLAKESRNEIFLHCGCVRSPGGQAYLFPGGSYTGKSTLVAHLASLGCEMLSDEYAVLTVDGDQVMARPFLRPLSLREGAPVPEQPVREAVGRDAVPIGQVFFLEYHDGASFELRPISAGQAALMLLQNAVAAQARAVEILSRLGLLCQQAVCLQGTRGEAQGAARLLLERFDPKGVSAASRNVAPP